MPTYRSLLAQKAALDKKIAQARKREIASVVKQINSLIDQYGLTPSELRFPSRSKGDSDAAPAKPVVRRRAKAAPTPPVAKYRDPASGQTWSGRGRAPRWIVGDKANYLIPEETANS